MDVRRRRRASVLSVAVSIYFCIENRKHTRIETHIAQTATRARMPPLDLKRLFEEERARRRRARADGASTSAAAAPDRLEALEARPAVSMADHDVGRFAARRISACTTSPSS